MDTTPISTSNKAVPYLVRMLAATLVVNIEPLLVKKKLGRITCTHHLSLLVERLRKAAGSILPGDGEGLWATLVESTNKDAASFDSSGTAQHVSVTQDLGNDIEEILDLDEGPFESSAESIEHAIRFRQWLQQEFIPPERLIVDVDSRTILFDGVLYKGFENEDALKMLDYLSRNPSKPIKLEALYKKATGRKGNAKTIREQLTTLCGFSEHIKSKAGVGHWFEFPILPPSAKD